MPQAISLGVLGLLNNTAIVGLIGGAGVVAIANAAPAILLGLALTAGHQMLVGQPNVPKPEDGKFNLKQTVPSLPYILGRVKKGGDYVFLEEKGGVAWHIMVHAAHSIQGYVEHWLHDERATFGPNGWITSPEHFISPNTGPKVRIATRVGSDIGLPYDQIVSAFPTIWTNNHRGDGLASVMMRVNSSSQQNFQKYFPQGMPQHSAVIDGHNRILDPRNGSRSFTRNIALHRLWHLTHPVGGRLTEADIYMPDWRHSANVCDQFVLNRVGQQRRRYHGGMWFRAENKPADVGRILDEAAQQVIYERADGSIGVHAGEFVPPSVRLTANDIRSLSYDANRRRATTVLAVRGRYTDPEKDYNTADAAIYGAPYPSDDERTKTVENQAVQDHNHMARLQKAAFIRANAPRVQIMADYEPSREVPYQRYITVHYPARLTEATVEIIGRPKLSLANLTYTFEGIVIPSTIYAFDATTEEGEPGSNVEIVQGEGIPLPIGFSPVVKTETVTGGSTAAFIEATFGFQNSAFRYELELEPVAGGPRISAMGQAGETVVRTQYLADGVQYRVRARTWGVNTSSDWTAPVTLTTTADPMAPGMPATVSVTGGEGQVTFNWTAPNSANYAGARLYLNTANSFASATLVGTEYGAPSAVDSFTAAGIAAGTYYGWVVAINGSGIGSAPAPTGLVTVT